MQKISNGFLTTGKGTLENVSEFQVQIDSMPLIHDAIMILVRVVTILIKSYLIQNVSHPPPYKHCNKPHVAAQLLHNIDPTTTSTS